MKLKWHIIKYKKNIENEKGVTMVALVVTIIVLMILTGIMVSNSNSQFGIKKVNDLYSDIDLISAKIDKYYLKNAELPALCVYKTGEELSNWLQTTAYRNNVKLLDNLDYLDNEQYLVIDLEKLRGSYTKIWI